MTFCCFINHLFIWWTDIWDIKYPFLDWYKNRQRNLVSGLKGLPLIPQLHLLFANSFVLTWVLSHSFAGFFLLVHSLKQTKRKSLPGGCSGVVLVHYSVSTQKNLLITAGSPSMYTSSHLFICTKSKVCACSSWICSGHQVHSDSMTLLSQSSSLPMRQTGKT